MTMNFARFEGGPLDRRDLRISQWPPPSDVTPDDVAVICALFDTVHDGADHRYQLDTERTSKLTEEQCGEYVARGATYVYVPLETERDADWQRERAEADAEAWETGR